MRGLGELASLLAAGALPLLAFAAVGLWMLRWLRADARGSERLALAYVYGSGACSLAILLARALDLPVTAWLLGVVALLGVPALRDLAPPPRPRGPTAPVDAVTLGVAAATWLAALAPETTWDGFEYHLPIARAWSEGPIRALPGLLDAEFRAGVDLLYVPALSVGAPDAAAAVSAGFAAALAALVRAEAARRASPAAGAWAGLFVLLVPFTLENAPTSYVDLAVGAYGFVALQRVDAWLRGAPDRALVAAAVALGFAANAKLHAAVLVPATLALLALGGRLPGLALLARCAAVVALLAAPWLVKTALTAGNPLFPLFGEWLGYGPSDAAHLAAKRGHVYHYVRVPRDAGGLAWYLTSLTFGRAYHVGGLLGPLPLALAPLALRGAGRPARALAGVLLALFALQFVFMPALRFGAPLLPWLAVATAVGGRRLACAGRVPAGVLGALLVGLGLLHGAWAVADYAPRIAALRDPQGHRAAVFPDQVALRDSVARAEPVVAIPQGAVSWLDQPVYNLHWARNGELFFDRRTPPPEALRMLRRRGVRSVVWHAAPDALADGRVDHPILDVWLNRGVARLRPGPRPAARGGRVWATLDLVEPEP